MYKKLGMLMVVAVLMLSGLAGCAPSATPTAEPVVEPTTAPTDVNIASTDAVALKVTGLVESEVSWTEEQAKAMNVISVESTNKDGETKSYDGVLLSDLLNQAKPTADAATVVFVADDGYTAEIALAEVMACTDCIVAFRDKGGFSTVLPGMDGSLQVKGVVEIQVK